MKRYQSRIYKSECGEYLCRSLGGGNFEAWRVDGAIHWRNDSRVRTWEDEKHSYPMERAVGAFSAEMAGQKPGSFTLQLIKCDTSKIVMPYQGNTVLESLEVVFRRRVPLHCVPKWLKET